MDFLFILKINIFKIYIPIVKVILILMAKTILQFWAQISLSSCLSSHQIK